MLMRKFSLIIYIACFLSSSFAWAISFDVLVFGETIRDAHKKIIPVAGKALADFLKLNGIHSEFTQDASVIQDENLNKYRVLVFLHTSEKILNTEQQKAVESFYRKGRGIVAIHSSIALGNDWPWFKTVVGTSFKSHTPIRTEKVKVIFPVELLKAGTSRSWPQADEWYEFKNKLDASVNVVATVKSRPIAWCRAEHGSGRFWYTSLGHSESLYTGKGPDFMKHLLAGIRWASGK